jgi:hypothetical protein
MILLPHEAIAIQKRLSGLDAQFLDVQHSDMRKEHRGKVVSAIQKEMAELLALIERDRASLPSLRLFTGEYQTCRGAALRYC